MRKQSWTWQTALDRASWSWCLNNLLASSTGELRPNVTNHLVCRGDALQLFRDILTELAQRTAAIGATAVRGEMGDYFPRKIFSKRLACRSATTLRICSG